MDSVGVGLVIRVALCRRIGLREKSKRCLSQLLDCPWSGEAEDIKVTVKKTGVDVTCAYCTTSGYAPFYLIEVFNMGRFYTRFDRCHKCIGPELIKEGLLW